MIYMEPLTLYTSNALIYVFLITKKGVYHATKKHPQSKKQA